MNWLLQWFLFGLLSRPIKRAVDWTAQERDVYESFCKSSCGQKLLEYLRQRVAGVTFKAVYQDAVSANAYARGQQDVLALLHQLRVFPVLEESSALDEQGLIAAARTDSVPETENSWRWVGGRGAIGQ